MKKQRRPKEEEKEEEIRPRIKMNDIMEIEDDEKMNAEERIKTVLDKAQKSNPQNKVNPKEKKYHVTKQKKPKNQIDQWVEDMLKAEISDLPTIHSFFTNSVKKEINNNEAKFYQDLINSVAYNTRLSVTDLLHGAYFNYYLGLKSFSYESNVFTNDRLYWITRLSMRLKNKRIYPFLKLSDNNVSLQTLAVAQDKGYRKGYVQDYEEDFSCIGLESLTNEEKKKLENTNELKRNNIKSYFYNNKEYNCITFEGGCTITFLKSQLDQVAEKIKKVRILGNKKNLTNEIKLYKLKAGKSVFISQNLNLTDFFPCEIITSNPLDFAFLFKFDIDMLAFENYLRANFKYTIEEGFDSFFQFYNLVQWNTFELMVNFLIVEKMTTYKEGENFANFRKEVEKFISEYNDIKRDVRNLRQIIEKIIKMLIRFFDSFPTRIKYAKIEKFSDPARELHERLKTEMRKGIPQKFEFFLRDHKLENTCITIYNSVKSNCSILDGILKRLNLLLYKVRNRQGGTIEDEAKKLGVEIFNVFDFYNNKNFLINVIRTPSIFLGNLLEDNEEKNRGVEEEKKKQDKKYMKYRERNEEIEKMLDMNKEDCIKRLIAVYFYENEEISDEDFETDDDKTIFKNNDLMMWFNNEVKKIRGYPDGDYFKKIAAKGAELLLSKALDLNNVDISEKTEEKLKFLIKSYTNYRDKNKIEDELVINENQKKINNLKKKNIDLKDNKRGYLRKGERVTVEFLKANKIDIINEGSEEYMKFVKWARDNGITDDVIKDAGDLNYKEIMKGKAPDLLKQLQEQTLVRYGPEAESDEEEEEIGEGNVEEEREQEDQKEEPVEERKEEIINEEINLENIKPQEKSYKHKTRKERKDEKKEKKKEQKIIENKGGNKGGKNTGKRGKK